MSQPWWGKERSKANAIDASRMIHGAEFKRPLVHPESPDEVIRQLRARRPGFVGEWADPDPEQAEPDAGGALVDLFSRLISPIQKRLNRMPDKSFIEFLDLAGVRPASPRCAEAMVQFTVSPAARDSIEVAKGFQLGARPATGTGDLVVFETRNDLSVTPATIVKVYVVQGAAQHDVTADNADTVGSFPALGSNPSVGDALVIGIGGAATLIPEISLGIQIATAPGAPPPISTGGVAPTPLPAFPVLRWESMIGSQFEPLVVTNDETASLWRSGIVQLTVPDRWLPTQYIGTDSLFWLRLRLIQGTFEKPPQVSFVRLNMARVNAVRTIQNEVLNPIDGPTSNRLQLQYFPIVAESLEITVESTPLDSDDNPADSNWTQVYDLAECDGQQHVYTLDPDTGVVTFGDGLHGAAIPPGFRNVRARRYEVTSGADSAVGSGEITAMLNSAQFLTDVTNLLPASGGVDADDQSSTLRNGPAVIHARERAVAVGDYAVMAHLAPGAVVRRAHAIPCLHPMFPGTLTPGVVAVFILPELREGGPPIPDEAALRAVGEFLSQSAAPAGVEIVTTAPKYRFIRAEVDFVATPATDKGEVMRNLTAELDRYLHPLTGGDDELGWPFGGTVYFAELQLRLLTRVKNLLAIHRLRLIVDGVPAPRCSDVSLGPAELFWPERHQVIPVEVEGT